MLSPRLFAALVLLAGAGCATPPRGGRAPAAEVVVQNEIEERNRVGLFLGGTRRGGESNTTIGLGYEREIVGLGGFGGVVETSPDDRDFVFIVPALYLHPLERIRFTLGPGMQFQDGDSAWLFRAGVGLLFPLGENISLLPEVSYDLAEGHDSSVIFGVSVGYGF